MEITVAAFTRTLDHPEFAHVSAGLALQAYLPDSYPIQQSLTRMGQESGWPGLGPHQDPHCQGRQPGDGKGGIGPSELAPGPL